MTLAMNSEHFPRDFEAELNAIFALALPEVMQTPLPQLHDLSNSGVKTLPGIAVFADTQEEPSNANT